MKHARLRSAIRAFGKLALLGITFLLGVFATAVVAAILDAVAASPAQPLPAPVSEQTTSAIQPAVEQQPAVSSTAEDEDEAWPDIQPLALSHGRTLLTRGATLLMLDASNQGLWSWSAGERGWPFVTDQPIVDSAGTIYVIGADMTLVALNASTGEEMWRDTASGRASYAQIENYKDDQYLVLVDMSGYDDTFGHRPENELRAYKGQDLIWSTSFPRDAELIVRHGKIYAVIYSEGDVEMREIDPSDGEFSCSC